MTKVGQADVTIIGAGPAGSIAAALLEKKGWQVTVVEAQRFPRFSIGESLLPYCLTVLDEAGLLSAVEGAGFQFKDGAFFVGPQGETASFDFRKKTSAGPETTWQVERARFDELLIKQVIQRGVEVRFETRVEQVERSDSGVIIHCDDGRRIESAFVLDASGFGRVLPRLWSLDRPVDWPPRTSVFTHVVDNIPSEIGHDRNKILVTIHPEMEDVWCWIIPFAEGRCSIGAVGPSDWLISQGDSPEAVLRSAIQQTPELQRRLCNAVFDTEVRQIQGYASAVDKLYGENYALLGNAGEFLDPVFSSGVTIAMKSASLACESLDAQLRGETVDWEQTFEQPLRSGINVFRAFVEAWYDGRLQTIFFSEGQSAEVRNMICSILAGYAWDEDNPYCKNTQRRIDTVAKLCALQ